MRDYARKTARSNGKTDKDGIQPVRTSSELAEDGKNIAINSDKETDIRNKIAKYRKEKLKRNPNIKVVKRSNKLVQALKLPKVLNLNPRGIYNKLSEFETFVKEESVELICMSESFEREEKTLEKLINIEDFEVISNFYQRKGKGGRPAVIVSKKNFNIENLTNTLVSIPWGVEIVWVALTPKYVDNASKVQKIIVGSIYSKPKSKKIMYG